MNNTEIKQAIKAGNQAIIAEAFKFDQLKALIRKLIGEAGKNADINIYAVLVDGTPFIKIRTDDLFDCWGYSAKQVWKHIYLCNGNSNFIELESAPEKSPAWVALDWRYELLDCGRNGMDFAELVFDFSDHPGEWQAQMSNGEVVTLA